MSKPLPRYPVYVISKGRFENCLTAKFLINDQVPFHLVVEPQEADEYARRYGNHRVLVLPFSNLGLGSIPARNWCWEHAKKAGHEWHWILDDNIRDVWRLYRGERLRCDSAPAFRAIEDFTDRYENIGISGMAYKMFVIPSSAKVPPFWQNVHVYSCLLIRNSLTYRWRGRYNEDTDLCLQVLSGGWCTVLVNAFMIEKMATMTMKGGNMTELYKGDGRLKMARSLERVWPHIVSVDRRFKRPQHVIREQWRKFDTQLKLKPGVDLSTLPKNDNYGLELKAVGEVTAPDLKQLLDDSKS